MEYLTFSRALSLGCLMAAQGPAFASFEQGNRALAYNGGILLAQFLGAFVLPPIHSDPFDRMLIGQAATEGFILVTSDLAIAKYTGPIRHVR